MLQPYDSMTNEQRRTGFIFCMRQANEGRRYNDRLFIFYSPSLTKYKTNEMIK